MAAAVALQAREDEDHFAAVRALNRICAAGFSLRVSDDHRLLATPAEQLSDTWRAFIREHKPALVDLLIDAETLRQALTIAGPAGLAWREGTPPDWADVRLLAAGEALYTAGRMVSVHGRRFATESAPAAPPEPTRVWDSERACWTF